MQNRTEINRHPARPERIREAGTQSACPDGNGWCRNHEEGEGGWCTGRTVRIADAFIDVTNGTTNGSLVLYGLSYLPENGVDLATARQIAETITELIEEVEPPESPASTTAAYSWRDIAATNGLINRLQFAEADRSALPLGSEDLREDFRTYASYGGMLVWNLTRDDETGQLVMLTGQTAAQERQVLANAGWLVSCGAVYAASRVGMKGWKSMYDDRVGHDGDEFLIWILSNDEDVSRV